EGAAAEGMPAGAPAADGMAALSDQRVVGETIDVVMVEAAAIEAAPAAASEEVPSTVRQPVEPVVPAVAPMVQPVPTAAPPSPPPAPPPAAHLPAQTETTTASGGGRLSPIVIALIIAVLLIAGVSALFLTGVIHLPS